MSSFRKHADTRETASSDSTQPNNAENQPHTDLHSTSSTSGQALCSKSLHVLFEGILATKNEVGTIPPRRKKSKSSSRSSSSSKSTSQNKSRKLTDKAPTTSTSTTFFSHNDTLPSPRSVMLHATTDNNNNNNTQRLSSSHDPSSSRAINGMNGAPAGGGLNGGSSSSMPIHAGQQMDLNFIFAKVLELSEQLRVNREQTQGLIAGAEELANRAAATGEAIDLHEANSQLTTARVADLTHKLSEAESINKTLLREQRENGKLIGEYEQALEKVVAMLRDYAFNKEMEKSSLAKQYLHTLQTERDEHLKTRLERDTANTHILKLIGQMRQAYKMSVEESLPEIEAVAGLQNEVRSLRGALGLPKQKFEEELGYSVLKHLQGGAGEEDD